MDAKPTVRESRKKSTERSSESATTESAAFDAGATPYRALGNQALQRLLASGQVPAPLLPRLASAIGNQAVQRLVQGTLPHQPATIQRYSEESLRTGRPINWWGETVTVDKAAEGISGGFYIMTSGGGQLGVKPDEEGPERADFAEQFLGKAMGVRTPQNSRTLKKGDAEAIDIRKTILSPKLTVPATDDRGDPVVPAKYREKVATLLDGANFYRIMPVVKGTTPSSAAKKATDHAKFDALTAMLSDPAILRGIGRLMVADAFLSNSDRISRLKQNLGNLMITQAREIVAIDSGANFSNLFGGRATLAGAIQSQGSDLRQLGSAASAQVVIDNFFGAIRQTLQAFLPPEQSGMYVGMFDAFFIQGGHKAGYFDKYIQEGIKEGREALRHFFTKQKNKRGELKKLAGTMGHPGINWDSFKVQEKYFLFLESGMKPEEALAKAEAYAKDRQARKSRPTGFKWTTNVPLIGKEN